VKVHLVDGTYELFRSYFGAPAATSPAGREVGATRGLMRSLLGLLTQPDVTHVGVAYDHVIESFRNGLYDGYKTSAGVPRELLGQFELAERATPPSASWSGRWWSSKPTTRSLPPPPASATRRKWSRS
jgi:5'-3' exonuclease